MYRHLLKRNLEVGDRPGVGAGFVSTYQALLKNAKSFERYCQDHRVILVLDEPHHAAEASTWAAALAPLVKRSALVVLMSGTMVRHDGLPIAFLPYREGQHGTLIFDPEWIRQQGGVCIEYSRAQALKEKAVIPLEVRWFDLSATWQEDGQQQSLFSLAAVEDEREAKESIHVALSTGVADEILLTCHRDWQEYRRKTNPRSKMLVVAANVAHAKALLKKMQEDGAQRAAIATSDKPTQAKRNIDNFKAHGTPDAVECLISVGMAYEGIDIPAITHIACLTNIRSFPWIEQMATRGTRIDRGPGALPYERQAAYLYCPDDVLMRECIERIIEQDDAIAHRPMERDEEGDLLDNFEDPEEEETGPGVIELLSSSSTLTGFADFEGGSLTRAEINQLPLLARALCTTEAELRGLRVAYIKRQLQAQRPTIERLQADPLLQPVDTHESAPSPTVTDSRTISELRRSVNALAKRRDAVNNWPFGTTNGHLKAMYGARQQLTATQLLAAEAWLNEQLQMLSVVR